MDTSPKIGLLGCGVITQRILAGLLDVLEEVGGDLVAACDLDTSNLSAIEKAAEGRPINCFTSIKSMLRGSQLDAVLIATPIAWHPEHVLQVLEAGCHAYTHKTLAPTSMECEALASKANELSLRLAASPGQILLPAYDRARKIVASGELGQLVSIDAATEAAPHRYERERANEMPPSEVPFSWEWYHQAEKNGGPLDDMLVYPVAFLTELLGVPQAAAVRGRLVTSVIEWRGRRITADTPDAYAGLVMFGDVPATLRASFSSNSARVPWGMTSLRGTDACLEIEKRNDLEYVLYVTPNEGEARVERHPVWDAETAARRGADECHVLTDIREFLLAVQSDRAVDGATPINAARVADTLSLIKTSAQHDGRWMVRGEEA